jgi:hypothetical protein
MKAWSVWSGHRERPLANVVVVLASDDGGWVTGQQIDTSGGQRL